MKDKDKFRGCLIGGAAGDALGYEVEFMRECEIFAEFGKSGITDYVLRNGKAIISDDTQMTLFTASAFLFDKNQTFPEGYLRQCYIDWYLTQNVTFPVRDRMTHSVLLQYSELFAKRAPGLTCMNAIMNGAKGTVKNPVNDSKGCGGIMRVSPIGLFYTDRKESACEIASYGADAAAMTHGHELGYIPSAAFTYIIYALSKGECSIKKAVIDSLEIVSALYPDAYWLGYFCELINKAIKLAESDINDLDALHQLGEGWVAEETLAVAVYCSIKYQNNFDKAIITSVNHNGDSDSTGAVTGNILGTYIGYNAIPEKYKNNLELHDIIINVADELYKIC